MFQNNGPNALHGGLVGLDKVLWRHALDQEAGTVSADQLWVMMT